MFEKRYRVVASSRIDFYLRDIPAFSIQDSIVLRGVFGLTFGTLPALMLNLAKFRAHEECSGGRLPARNLSKM
jgi:hypothetical protein